MKVAICITGLEVGGAETVLADLLAHAPEDFEFKVFSLIDGGEIAKRIAAMGIPVEGLHMRAGVPSVAALLSLTRALNSYRPDIVHTWLYHADLMGGVASKLAGVPHVIWHLHNSDLSPTRTRFMTRLVVRVCAILSRSVPDVILSCSEAGATVHTKLGYSREKVRVVPNGVDAERFAPSPAARAQVREEFGIPVDAPLVGLVARVDPQKNHAGFFEAAKDYFTAGGDAWFLLVGREVTEAHWQLPRWREATGRPERIILAGPRSDVPRVMAALDVATSSSLGEAFPMTLIEAMATGVPCVATDVGDCALIVDDVGVIVPPGEPAQLARGWSDVLGRTTAERAALGSRARERVLAEYTIEQMAASVWATYRSLIC